MQAVGSRRAAGSKSRFSVAANLPESASQCQRDVPGNCYFAIHGV